MESEKRKAEEVVDKWKGINKQIKGEKKRNKTELKVSYTNADGILSKRLECLDNLKRERPDIMCIVETKLTPNTDISQLSVVVVSVVRRYPALFLLSAHIAFSVFSPVTPHKTETYPASSCECILG